MFLVFWGTRSIKKLLGAPGIATRNDRTLLIPVRPRELRLQQFRLRLGFEAARLAHRGRSTGVRLGAPLWCRWEGSCSRSCASFGPNINGPHISNRLQLALTPHSGSCFLGWQSNEMLQWASKLEAKRASKECHPEAQTSTKQQMSTPCVAQIAWSPTQRRWRYYLWSKRLRRH